MGMACWTGVGMQEWDVSAAVAALLCLLLPVSPLLCCCLPDRRPG